MRNGFVAAFVAAGLVCGSAMSGAAEREGYRRATAAEAALAGVEGSTELWIADGSAATPAPSDFYGTQPAMTTYAGNYFQPRQSSMQWTSLSGAGDITYASGDNFADAHIFLPTGVVIDNVRWWANDTVAGDALFFFFTSCVPAGGPGGPTNTIQTITPTSGAGGEQSALFALAPAVTVDNNACSYWVRINFQGSVGLTLRRVRVQWHRQISPAPATATFSDVPTTHPFFRFVEALAAAGITGGCSATQYCPNGNLTRGEMAVFLSTALGLHFPN